MEYWIGLCPWSPSLKGFRAQVGVLCMAAKWSLCLMFHCRKVGGTGEWLEVQFSVFFSFSIASSVIDVAFFKLLACLKVVSAMLLPLFKQRFVIFFKNVMCNFENVMCNL